MSQGSLGPAAEGHTPCSVVNEPPLLKSTYYSCSTNSQIPNVYHCRSASEPTKARMQNMKHNDVVLWLTNLFLCPTS